LVLDLIGHDYINGHTVRMDGALRMRPRYSENYTLDGWSRKNLMSQAFIVDTLRTSVGRRNGALAQIHPAHLTAAPLAALFDRLGIDTAEYDEIILGCIDQIGPQAFDIARTAWLAAGGSEAVPGTTIDRQCGSGQQAVHYAAQAVMSGTSDLVVA